VTLAIYKMVTIGTKSPLRSLRIWDPWVPLQVRWRETHPWVSCHCEFGTNWSHSRHAAGGVTADAKPVGCG
jgi:hypothetical protein